MHPGLMYDDYIPESASSLVRASGKLALLHNILPKLQLAGHRYASKVHTQVHNAAVTAGARTVSLMRNP